MGTVCLVSSTLQPTVGPADANRLLAREFVRAGRPVMLAALNDPHVAREERGVRQGEWGPELRLSCDVTWSARAAAFRAAAQRNGVTHIILRFVCYSFQRRGVVVGASQYLPRAFADLSTTVLLDETWIGGEGEPLRHRVLGMLQRWSTVRLIRRLRPKLVVTNNRYNHRVLLQQRVPNITLRLPGNIPLVAGNGGEYLMRELNKAGIDVVSRDDWLIVLNFGSCHPGCELGALIRALLEWSGKKQICFVSIGRLGESRRNWEALARDHGGEATFVCLGERDPKEISLSLQAADLGFSSTPHWLLGKSGTAMAMLDHGLPIIVVRTGPDDDSSEFPAHQVLRFEPAVGGKVIAALRRFPARNGARAFVRDLESCWKQLQVKSRAHSVGFESGGFS